MCIHILLDNSLLRSIS
uniref:Uncharacterized protein n=1 Tax=Anguilla anguilla TaxID=7936 RepID=A0A0E9Q3K2_ANGAN